MAKEDENWRMPFHNVCGLPVELCACPDARVKFIDGKFVDTKLIRGRKMKVSRSSVCRVVEACLELGARKAEIYLSPDLVVRATRRHKLNGSRCNQIHHEILLTIGKPNYAEREFIKDCKKAGEPFLVKKIQLKWFPKKR